MGALKKATTFKCNIVKKYQKDNPLKAQLYKNGDYGKPHN